MSTSFTISKDVYFNSISTGFKDNISLLDAVRMDFPRMDIIVNKKKQECYHSFLEFIKTYYNDYLYKILLLTNQNAHFYYYNKIFEILSKHDYHFVSDDSRSKKYLRTEFNISPFIKQACLYNKYNVITIDDNGHKIHRTLLITTIIDLVILDPIVVNIKYID